MRRLIFTDKANNYEASINFRVGGTVGARSISARNALLRRAQGDFSRGCCFEFEPGSDPTPPTPCEESLLIDFSPESSSTTPPYNFFNLGPISDSATSTIQGGWSGGAQTYFQNDSTDDETISNTFFKSSPYSWYVGAQPLYGNPGQGSPFTPALPLQTDAASEAAFNAELFTKTVKYSFDFYVKGNSSTPLPPEQLRVYNGSYQGNDRTGLNLLINNNYNTVDISSYTYSGGSFSLIPLATGLATNTWHNIEINITYDADPDNDTFIYSVNGGAGQSVLSWPNVWRKDNAFTPVYGTWLAFGKIETNIEGSGFGFYIDNISMCLNSKSSASNLLPSPPSESLSSGIIPADLPPKSE